MVKVSPSHHYNLFSLPGYHSYHVQGEPKSLYPEILQVQYEYLGGVQSKTDSSRLHMNAFMASLRRRRDVPIVSIVKQLLRKYRPPVDRKEFLIDIINK